MMVHGLPSIFSITESLDNKSLSRSGIGWKFQIQIKRRMYHSITCFRISGIRVANGGDNRPRMVGVCDVMTVSQVLAMCHVVAIGNANDG